eukprot:s142_g2.t1
MSAALPQEQGAPVDDPDSGFLLMEKVEEALVRPMVFHIACALAHAHELGVVHRDLKPENILLRQGDRFPKVADFGLSRSLRASEVAMTVAGTPTYMAPEIQDLLPYDFPADVYSLGCILTDLMDKAFCCSWYAKAMQGNHEKMRKRKMIGQAPGLRPSCYQICKDLLSLADENVLPNALWQERPKLPTGPPLQKMLSPELAADIAGRGGYGIGVNVMVLVNGQWFPGKVMHVSASLCPGAVQVHFSRNGEEQATLVCPWQFQELLRPAAVVPQGGKIGTMVFPDPGQDGFHRDQGQQEGRRIWKSKQVTTKPWPQRGSSGEDEMSTDQLPSTVTTIGLKLLNTLCRSAFEEVYTSQTERTTDANIFVVVQECPATEMVRVDGLGAMAAASTEPKAPPWSDGSEAHGDSATEVQKWLECAECRFPLVRAEELIAERCTVRTDVAWCYELDVFDQQVSCYSATNAHDHRFDVVRVDAPSALTRSILQERIMPQITRVIGMILHIVCEGEATAEFSWFPGFAWSMAHCANCYCHLGWAFEAETAAQEEPDPASKPDVAFFGLVLTMLELHRAGKIARCWEKMREHQWLEGEVTQLFEQRAARGATTRPRSGATSPRRELRDGLISLVQTIQQTFRSLVYQPTADIPGHFPLDEAMLTSLDETQRMLTRHRRIPEVVATPLRRSATLEDPMRLLQRLRNSLRRGAQNGGVPTPVLGGKTPGEAETEPRLVQMITIGQLHMQPEADEAETTRVDAETTEGTDTTQQLVGLLHGFISSREWKKVGDSCSMQKAVDCPEGIIRSTAKHILTEFGTWDSPDLREMTNFSNSGRCDGTSDCYVLGTRSIQLDAQTRWLAVAVVPSTSFTGSRAEQDAKIAAKMASIDASTQILDQARARGRDILMVMTVLSIAASLIFGRLVSKPLRHLTQTMMRLGELDFTESSLILDIRRNSRRVRVREVLNLQLAFCRLARGISTFARFVPESVVRNIVMNGEGKGTRLEVSRRMVTIMCTDIKGFTSISERLRPRDLLYMLMRYFSVMMRVVELYGGIVLEILGDGLIVFWNAPDTVEDHPGKACAAALTQLEALGGLNGEYGVYELPELSIRIGIHTGSSLVGNIGSERMKYGCLGDTKQVAMKLEDLCKYYGVDVICSSSTKNMTVPSRFFFRELDYVQLQPDADQMTLYEVICREVLDDNDIDSTRDAGSRDSLSVRDIASDAMTGSGSLNSTSQFSHQSMPSIHSHVNMGDLANVATNRREMLHRWLAANMQETNGQRLERGEAIGTPRLACGAVVHPTRTNHSNRTATAEQQRRIIGQYEKALKAFHAGDLTRCIQIVNKVLEEKEDPPSRKLLEIAGERMKAEGTASDVAEASAEQKEMLEL